MKKKVLISVGVSACCLAGTLALRMKAAQPDTFQVHEYGTIRWAGKDNTHFIRPNGQVEILGPILTQLARPDKADERALLMNVAMNAVAKEGFEFAGMTSDSIVMKRAVPR
jgi:hypothetical protein